MAVGPNGAKILTESMSERAYFDWNATAPLREGALRAMPHDREFVRLLANMLLRTQSEVMHVY